MNYSARLKSKLIKFTVGALLLAGLSLSGTGDASAADASITTAPKMGVVIDGGHEIDPAYSFVPQFTANTKLTTYGSTYWRTTVWNDSDSRKFRSIDLYNYGNRDSLKGNIGATYTNVGYFKGQSVDLKIELRNWLNWGLPGKIGTAGRVGSISFEEKNIAISTTGYKYVDTVWKYVKSGTNTPIAVSGYFTFSDIDLSQGLKFSGVTSTNIHKYLIQDRQNVLKFQNDSGQHYFYDTTDNERPDLTYDHKYAFTFLYGNLSIFQLRWQTDWYKSDNASVRFGRLVTPDRYYYANVEDNAQGEYLFFVINKPTATKIQTPTKTVIPSSGYKIGNKLKYEVEHDVPQESSSFYYTKYVMSDDLDNTLKNPTLVVRNAAGSNVTSWFDVSTSGGVVTATAKATTLKKTAFYGDTYTFTIQADVDRPKLVTAIGSGSSYSIANTANIITNRGTVTTNRVTTPITKRVLTVRHIDDKTNAVIATTTEAVFDGETYSKSPRTDLKKGNLNYKATSTTPRTGTVNGSNVSIDFRYTLPSMDVGIEAIEITTDKVTEGLPTKVDISSNLPTGSSLADFSGAQVKLEVIDLSNGNKSIDTQLWNIESMPSAYKFDMKADYLTKGNKVNYDFRLTIPGGDDSGLKSTTGSVRTHGYSSAEKKLTTPNASNQLTFNGVVLTVKEGSAPVIEFDESLVVTVPELPRQKTGYGFTAGVNATYMNELRNLDTVKTAFTLDSDLIDSHLNYPKTSGMSRIDLERTISTTSSDGKSVTTKHELPRVKVERYTGDLFTFQQVADGDAEMDYAPSTYNYADGGRKLYAPIWAELGLYDYEFISTESIGVHAVTFDVAKELEIYAYMFNHTDSPTADDDELLLHPLAQGEIIEGWELGEVPKLEGVQE